MKLHWFKSDIQWGSKILKKLAFECNNKYVLYLYKQNISTENKSLFSSGSALL